MIPFGLAVIGWRMRPVRSRRDHRFFLLLATAAVAAAVSQDWPRAAAAEAQGRLDARYRATLAGLPIGKGAWVIEIGEGKYLAAASGTTSGLLRLFSGGQGTGAARGTIDHGRLIPAAYTASLKTGRKTSEVRMSLGSGDVKSVSVTPPPKPDAERVPLTEAHRHGVQDPMSASLFRAAGGHGLAPASCDRTVPVFDGNMRYDLRLTYKRTGQVRAPKGYAGPALVCAIQFQPIAGHDPGRLAIRWLTELRGMEIWLAPIVGTPILVPFRFTVPTPFGLGLIEATQFVSGPQATHPTRTSAKAR